MIVEKYSRNARIALITKKLIENPSRILSLSYFADALNAAKSTISEDLLIVREAMEASGEGRVETIPGAAGGVRFHVRTAEAVKSQFAGEILEHFSDNTRIVPGNFLYVTDLMQNPRIVAKAGAILAEYFYDYKPDYIITVETKGIPLAYEVDKSLGIQLIVARRNTKITEGTSVMINYLTGSQGLLSVMSLSKRSIRPGSKLIFIDDFLRGGGTVRGIIDLLHEFSCELIGIGVMVDNKDIEKSLPVPMFNFCDYHGIDNAGNILIKIHNIS